MRVQEVMTCDVHSVRPEASLKEVAKLLWRHEIGGVPVLDERMRPVGVISKTDIVIKERAEVPARRPWRMFGHNDLQSLLLKVTAHTAGEAMSTPAITIEPQMPLLLAAEQMLDHGLNRLPVVSREKLVGIVTRFDLMGAFARGDSELEREIRETALDSLNWPEAVDLTIHDGKVALRGEVDSARDAKALPIQIRHILGVVSVDAELAAWDPHAQCTRILTTRL